MGALITLCLGLAVLGGPAAQVIDLCNYPSNAAARERWAPFDAGLPVEAQARGVRLPFDMSGDHQRAYWDQALELDLSRHDRFAFDFFVQDGTKSSPVFNIYFQSEAGWYRSSFGADPGWNRIRLSKAQFIPEEQPTGWHRITRVRVGAWKSVDGTGSLAIADLKAVASDVAVILGDKTPSTSPEFGTATTQAQVVARLLEEAGIEAGGLTDTDVESGALQGRKIAIFPHNPDMTAKEMDEVDKFVQAGGKVIGFYTVHPRLLRTIGAEITAWRPQEFPGQYSYIQFDRAATPDLPPRVQQASWNTNVVRPIRPDARVIGTWLDKDGRTTGIPALLASDTGAYMGHILLNDDGPGKAQMLLALLGRYHPALWEAAVGRAETAAAQVGEYATFAEATAKLGPAAVKPAKAWLDAAIEAKKAKRFSAAISAFGRAKSALVDAYCAAHPPKKGEVAAVWCHSAEGVPGLTWDQTISQLAANGIDRVLPNMLWAGVAYYPSKVLPVAPSVATTGDQIAQCLAAGRKHGVEVHVWKVNWNLLNAPKEFVDKLKAEGRTQRDPSGRDTGWLCPSHPANFQLERDSMLEVVRNYAVDGIHFDYIRYPEREGCYCDGCRQRFEAKSGSKVPNWPADVASGDLMSVYDGFRREQITRLVRAVSIEARRIRPKIQISAAVFADWPQCRDSVAQDWVAWVKEGLVDFVCPMDYTSSANQFGQWTNTQNAAIGKSKPFLPGIGVSLDTIMSPDQVVRQITVGRRNGAAGFTLFNLDAAILRDLLPRLRKGVTKGG